MVATLETDRADFFIAVQAEVERRHEGVAVLGLGTDEAQPLL